MGPEAGKGPVANLGQETVRGPVGSYDSADCLVLEVFIVGKDVEFMTSSV